ncbi:pentapeptide repeat-containing protein [Paenibacillus sp. J45TS6]|uniref:pentapeptide repeat-containing protein n=1 Tax=Paenibacillus sp. J45TS6 TaxID=2807196 RepID=UPI001BD0CACD
MEGNLQQVKLHKARLHKARLRKVRLRKVRLRKVRLRKVRLRKVRLRKVKCLLLAREQEPLHQNKEKLLKEQSLQCQRMELHRQVWTIFLRMKQWKLRLQTLLLCLQPN